MTNVKFEEKGGKVTSLTAPSQISRPLAATSCFMSVLLEERLFHFIK